MVCHPNKTLFIGIKIRISHDYHLSQNAILLLMLFSPNHLRFKTILSWQARQNKVLGWVCLVFAASLS